MIQKIIHNKKLMALIIKRDFNEPGIHFFTPEDFSQQLAYISHPAGKIIEPHTHNPINRQVYYSHEVLFIRRGKLRVDIYDEQQSYIQSCTLEGGDVIFLARGGHGLEVLEEIEMIEVKQGPYTGEAGKVNFKGIIKKSLT
jgi:hypothetical protein